MKKLWREVRRAKRAREAGGVSSSSTKAATSDSSSEEEGEPAEVQSDGQFQQQLARLLDPFYAVTK